MRTLKKCARMALQDMAARIIDGDETAWRIADRIERRWKMQGCTLALVDAHIKRREEFRRAERKRFDFLFPDRLTYLHR